MRHQMKITAMHAKEAFLQALWTRNSILESDFIAIWLIWDKLCQHLFSIRPEHCSYEISCILTHCSNRTRMALGQVSPTFYNEALAKPRKVLWGTERPFLIFHWDMRILTSLCADFITGNQPLELLSPLLKARPRHMFAPSRKSAR